MPHSAVAGRGSGRSDSDRGAKWVEKGKGMGESGPTRQDSFVILIEGLPKQELKG